MTLVINTNVGSINAQRHLAVNTHALSKTMEKLASGFRINRASDDAAGLQLSENLRSQIRGSKKALDNVQDGINLLNIVDGIYGQMTDNLQRMRELAVQAASTGSSDPASRAAAQAEVEQILEDGEWAVMDSWSHTGGRFARGSFGFHVPGRSEIGLRRLVSRR